MEEGHGVAEEFEHLDVQRHNKPLHFFCVCHLCFLLDKSQVLTHFRMDIYRRKGFDHIPPPEEKADGNKQPMVAYSVQYLDREGGDIGTQPHPTTFDLDVARHAVLKFKASVFGVVTVLKTSHSPEAFRYLSDESRLDRLSHILSDASITVNVHATKIIIESQALVNAIRTVVRYYPQIDLEGKSLELDEPYAVIGHHLRELESLRQGPQDSALDPKTTEHLGLLLDYLHTNVYKDKIDAERILHLKDLCTFQMLWLLFKPGTTVYLEFRGNLEAYVVQSVVSDPAILSDVKQRLEPYKIKLWSLRYDGRFVGRTSTEVVLPPFGGERAITSLKVFPCEYRDKTDGGKTKRQLEENGRKWYNLLLGKQMRYHGELFDQRSLEARLQTKTTTRIATSRNHRRAP
ncbi:uncharacterized protein PODANS_5_310 [Podospora anserina S mat+]|uniref:Podospora anserina S mat+ genomic DNA chromosome 5, supercontig 1 n=1 Tax=Podospora anserina (strain S / ATCC MYA-4624 / DSM 980 / FGSC 10383) TaxID=515849 RepID=B2AF77_PODAN|nr:uncharacterized protein PODANS_5_310 [Podospora anserina S mat+]CAP62094.1 unnamed protein product [Podospora anserina S mat+]CDP29170.1 Putative protein of unknown function [Podospora anserina S mat+]